MDIEYWKKRLHLSIIVAMSENRVIGKDGCIPWKLPSDQQHFKDITTSAESEPPVVMGRVTAESILRALGKPLPNRHNIVLTKNPEKSRILSKAGFTVVRTLEETLETACKKIEEDIVIEDPWELGRNPDDIFIIGGEQLYKATLEIAETIYLTRVHIECMGDTFFPDVTNDKEWRFISCANQPTENGQRFSFCVYKRNKP